MIGIRKAEESDRKQIAYCIAEGFAKDFSGLSTNTKVVAEAIESGINTERFYVTADDESGVIGALAIADCNGRSISTDKAAYKEYFGFIKGVIASKVLKEEFEKPLLYPDTVGYIESVCVLKKWRRRGITTRMLEYVLEKGGYENYELDVTNINTGAIECYQKMGFSEYRREKQRFAKQKGFSEKIYMKYTSK